MRSFTMALIGLAVALPVGVATVPAHADSGGFFDNAQQFFNNWGNRNEPQRYEHHRRDENGQRYGWNEHNRYGEHERGNPEYNQGHGHEHWRGNERHFGYNGDQGWNNHQHWEHHHGNGAEWHYGYNDENRGYQGGRGYQGDRSWGGGPGAYRRDNH